MNNFIGQGRTLELTQERSTSAQQQTVPSANQQQSQVETTTATNSLRYFSPRRSRRSSACADRLSRSDDEHASSKGTGHSYANTERIEHARAAYGNIGDAHGGRSHSYNDDKGSGNSKGVLGNMDRASFDQFMR